MYSYIDVLKKIVNKMFTNVFNGNIFMSIQTLIHLIIDLWVNNV